MFNTLETAAPDAILGLTEAFKKDPNPKKINLSVGVYKDAEGNTPILETVKEAEARILGEEKTKGYVGIEGDPAFGQAVRALMFGEGHEALSRACTAHTPGGTGSLRVAADFIHTQFPDSRVWMSNPTWANHGNVFAAAGVETVEYPYYDADAKELDCDAMLATLREVPANDFVLLHGCCHNPCGMDPSPEQWKAVADVAGEAGWTPLFDFAYHGLADGIEEDATGPRTFLRPGAEMLVCSSFSKNFGLYRERVGAITVVGESPEAAAKAQSHIKKCIRANYSQPPSHGAAIVTTILSDPELRSQWVEEVKDMRDRINGMRRLFVDTLKAKGVERDFSFLVRQRGMFSFSGLTKAQVDMLRNDYSIYVVGSGRINVAGMTPGNMDRLCDAIAAVLKG